MPGTKCVCSGSAMQPTARSEIVDFVTMMYLKHRNAMIAAGNRLKAVKGICQAGGAPSGNKVIEMLRL